MGWGVGTGIVKLTMKLCGAGWSWKVGTLELSHQVYIMDQQSAVISPAKFLSISTVRIFRFYEFWLYGE